MTANNSIPAGGNESSDNENNDRDTRDTIIETDVSLDAAIDCWRLELPDVDGTVIIEPVPECDDLELIIRADEDDRTFKARAYIDREELKEAL